jgi:hypothetical protein
MAATKAKSTGGKPDKLIRDALKAAIRQEPEKLKRMAEKVLDMAVEGDMQSVNFIADRIDGKAVQQIIGDEENPLHVAVSQIQRIIIDPKNDSTTNTDS